MLHTLLIIVHVIICLVLAVVVLLQSSKGGGLAGAFGGAGGAPQQLLGSRGITTLLHKITIYCAIGFFVTSFLLFMTGSYTGTQSGTNVIGTAAEEGTLAVPLQESPVQQPATTPTETPVEDDGGSN